MRLLVTLQAHCMRYGSAVFSEHLTYDAVWRRYREVFEQVLVAARMRDLPNVPAGVAKATGPGVEFFAWKYLRKTGRPFGVEVVADPYLSLAPGSVKSIVRPWARRSIVRRLQAQCREAQTALYVTTQALQQRYPPGPQTCAIGCSDVVLDDDAIVEDLSGRLEKLAGVPERLAGKGRPVRLGFIGSFSRMYKAPDVHIQAVARCVSQGADLLLDMVGDGGRLAEMQALARALGISERVRFRGRLPNGPPIFDYLDSVDLFLNASRQEGLPRSLVEAMSRGCPAIATDIGGIPELLGPACLVPVNDAPALAKRMMAFLIDVETLSAAARRNVEVAGGYARSVLDPRRREHYAELRRRTEASSSR